MIRFRLEFIPRNLWIISRVLAGYVMLVAPIWIAVGAAANTIDPAQLSEEEKAEGFRLLFNNQDLDGWMEVQGKPGTFKVKEGRLIGERNRKTGSAYWLSTKQRYGDFELRLQFRLAKGGNSGVFIRAPHEGRTSREGMEIQLMDDGNSKGKPSKGSTGAIYGVVAPRRFAAKPPGEWNDLSIACHGDRVRVSLNGEIINDASMADHESLKKRPRSGYIGLSAHTRVVEFRRVRLRHINGT